MDGDTETKGPLTIVTADRGHVWVGNADFDAHPDLVTITGARIVRRWGTSGKGLNFLATNGPQTSTVLDSPATVMVAKRAIIALVPCEESAWKIPA